MKRSIIPIFIPHLGCPHNCIFCDQKQIAAPVVPDGAAVQAIIEGALPYAKSPQVSFYGGSFTAIPREEMVEYLEAVRPYIRAGQCSSIRLSTRPDAIDREVLEILQAYGVRTIELGAQSMSDAVLRKAGRGHLAADTIRASRLIRQYGFELILQMMVGLPGSSYADEIDTARALCALQPDGVRIYPTCVLAHTPLCDLYRRGAYTPLTIEQAVETCCDLADLFEGAGIPIIRMGLNPTEELSGGAVAAGPYHPAFGEMVMGERFYRAMLPRLPQDGRACEIIVPPRMLSIAIGQKKRNLRRFAERADVRIIRAEAGCTAPFVHML